jgi:hypothetical protein
LAQAIFMPGSTHAIQIGACSDSRRNISFAWSVDKAVFPAILSAFLFNFSGFRQSKKPLPKVLFPNLQNSSRLGGR